MIWFHMVWLNYLNEEWFGFTWFCLVQGGSVYFGLVWVCLVLFDLVRQ